MALVHDAASHWAQAVIHRAFGIVVGASGGNDFNVCPCRGAGSHDFKKAGIGAIVFKVQVRKIEVLVGPAGDQLSARATFVEPGFPALDVILLSLVHAGNYRADGTSLVEPAGECGVFIVGEACHGQRHALVGVVAGVVGEIGVADTLVGARQAQFYVFGQFAVGCKLILFAQANHVFKQAAGLVASSQYREKTHFSPLLFGLCIDAQAGGSLGFEAGTVVNRVFMGTANQAVGVFHFELAGCVKAAVAREAFGFHNGAHVFVEADRLLGGGGQCLFEGGRRGVFGTAGQEQQGQECCSDESRHWGDPVVIVLCWRIIEGLGGVR